jgi:hypothetical protein
MNLQQKVDQMCQKVFDQAFHNAENQVTVKAYPGYKEDLSEIINDLAQDAVIKFLNTLSIRCRQVTTWASN